MSTPVKTRKTKVRAILDNMQRVTYTLTQSDIGHYHWLSNMGGTVASIDGSPMHDLTRHGQQVAALAASKADLMAQPVKMLEHTKDGGVLHVTAKAKGPTVLVPLNPEQATKASMVLLQASSLRETAQDSRTPAEWVDAHERRARALMSLLAFEMLTFHARQIAPTPTFDTHEEK